MKDRIIQIMKSEGMSNADFAEKIGISTSSLSHIFSGRNNPSLDVVTRIHRAYPDINIMWLLYGEGEMKSSGLNSGDIAGRTGGGYDDNGSSEGCQDDFGMLNGDFSGSENRENTHQGIISFDFRTDEASERAKISPNTTVKEEIRYIERPQPKITEIRIFFDNGTFEVFKPDNSGK